jgi:hypothetical protein
MAPNLLLQEILQVQLAREIQEVGIPPVRPILGALEAAALLKQDSRLPIILQMLAMVVTDLLHLFRDRL